MEKSRDLIGQVLHETYRITRVIGEGGMGAVYEAVHVRLAKKRFAVKMLLPQLVQHREVFARFRREAEIATELGHPHIVDVLDFNLAEDGRPYMVMELLDGEDMGRVLGRGPMPLPTVMAILEQAGSALQAAHQHGVVHRDMKPDNIFLVGPAGGPINIKVLDFGISKIKHATRSMATRENAVMGTPQYMSPEQARGDVGDIDHTTDIFALGVICYQALSGELPFDAENVTSVLYRICHERQRNLGDLVKELPDGVSQVVDKALAKNKQDRYQRAVDFVEGFRAALSAVTEAATQPMAPVPLAAALASSDRPTVPGRVSPSGPAEGARHTTLSTATGEGTVLPAGLATSRAKLIVGGLVVGLAGLAVTASLFFGGGSTSTPVTQPASGSERPDLARQADRGAAARSAAADASSPTAPSPVAEEKKAKAGVERLRTKDRTRPGATAPATKIEAKKVEAKKVEEKKVEEKKVEEKKVEEKKAEEKTAEEKKAEEKKVEPPPKAKPATDEPGREKPPGKKPKPKKGPVFDEL